MTERECSLLEAASFAISKDEDPSTVCFTNNDEIISLKRIH